MATYTFSERLRAIELVRGGENYITAARAVGCGPSAVNQWCSEAGVRSHHLPIRKQKLSEAVIARLDAARQRSERERIEALQDSPDSLPICHTLEELQKPGTPASRETQGKAKEETTMSIGGCRGPRKWTDEQGREAARLMKEGMPKRAACAKVGIPVGSADVVWKKFGEETAAEGASESKPETAPEGSIDLAHMTPTEKDALIDELRAEERAEKRMAKLSGTKAPAEKPALLRYPDPLHPLVSIPMQFLRLAPSERKALMAVLACLEAAS